MRPTQIDPLQYDSLLSHKSKALQHSFTEFDMPELEIFPSTKLNYRMRAEFRVWHDGADLFHIMFDSQNKEKYQVSDFPPASNLINQVMQDLLSLLKQNEVARRKLFQIDYLSTLSGEIVVSLLYHKPLDENWQAQIEAILNVLREKYVIDIVGRARKQKMLMDKDFVTEKLLIKGKTYTFKQIENSFTQPNAQVNINMIEWALDVTQNSQGDLLELYCGLGNFSIPMAQNFARVLATEISKTSVAAAQVNIHANGTHNVTILRMSSEEFVEAQQGKREFNRLQGIDLSVYDCQTVLVDPPRAGLDDETVKMVQQYQNIVYISCNPETLNSNLQVLNKTHKVQRFALFDQFPYTHHVEAGVYLTRR
ncbi:tRNA (uridine(54)-C5)-methyltransferase TrmA [Aliiglaciecola sp. LCG003]|uniref:tRNA (uridine(54)-C5)-methyltransferase TrmA n=1 Tax=Aliiglaciecola sp. LCG003 TaxID=3053655 RepID=UPI00257278E2|nr:tRNA (uridine(54)-C5)-methyltransferase TrmA [Aliiglaciecola sp. LCG003]WJG11244.1 tRNA (uridine(54)-C5)-methyltransferase TrmA [Aliiglaciecola sp. LCG003]